MLVQQAVSDRKKIEDVHPFGGLRVTERAVSTSAQCVLSVQAG